MLHAHAFKLHFLLNLFKNLASVGRYVSEYHRQVKYNADIFG